MNGSGEDEKGFVPLWRDLKRLEIALVVAFLRPEPSKMLKRFTKATKRQGNREIS